MDRVLVTGGAGFIGSHIVAALLEAGYEVRVLDNLEPQVHGPNAAWPDYLNPECERLRGDVRDPAAVKQALQGVRYVLHKAAAVGVGQSMYEIVRYTDNNTMGAANLLEVIISERFPVQKMIVASSMSIYGEGTYRCPEHGIVFPRLRPEAQLKDRDWEVRCPRCGASTAKVPTNEEKPLFPTSIYAITKRDHEEMFLATGQAYGIPAVALRYFNVYGPNQALSNPYTGVAAIFSGRVLNGNRPVIYEDGLQSRDFIHVRDIARANVLALKNSAADHQVLNVGSGRGISILEIANTLIAEIAPHSGLTPEVVQKYRAGDIRHCFADATKIKDLLGFEPKIPFREGVKDLTAWVAKQQATDGFEQARRELDSRGLTRG